MLFLRGDYPVVVGLLIEVAPIVYICVCVCVCVGGGRSWFDDVVLYPIYI